MGRGGVEVQGHPHVSHLELVHYFGRSFGQNSPVGHMAASCTRRVNVDCVLVVADRTVRRGRGEDGGGREMGRREQEHTGTWVLRCFGLMGRGVTCGRLIEERDGVGHAVSSRATGVDSVGRVGRVEHRVVWQAVAGTAELAGQGLVQVELGGDGAAAVVVQVVLAAQLALLAQRRQAGRALLLQVAGIWKRKGPKVRN